MTTEQHDPWALLREARKEMGRHRFDQESPACVLCGGESGFDVGRRCPEAHDYDLATRIDAALAERQDSATDVVAWRPSDQRVFLDGVSLRVVYQTGGLWMWSVYWPLSHRTEQGQVATENEAKQAAIAAAKEMR